MIALRPLARLATSRDRGGEAARCELCTAPVATAHRHVVELGVRGVLCACHACALLFTAGERNARYRTVPDRVRFDRGFALPLDRIGIPVGVAFCVRSADPDRLVACYPGPAGIVDAELADDAWRELAAATKLCAALEPEVEALLVRAERDGACTCYLVPITSAYELVARLRASWRGFSGGDQAQREIAAFFAELDRKGVSV